MVVEMVLKNVKIKKGLLVLLAYFGYTVYSKDHLFRINI